MAINVSVQYNGGLLLGIVLLTQCYYHYQFKYHDDVLSLQPMIPPKRFDIFSPCVGCSGLDAFIFFGLIVITQEERFSSQTSSSDDALP